MIVCIQHSPFWHKVTNFELSVKRLLQFRLYVHCGSKVNQSIVNIGAL